MSLYLVLELSSNCSDDDIKKAYRRLALKYHPDRCLQTNISREEATRRFKEIGEAYATLSDPQKRRVYDMGGSSSAAGGFRPFSFADANSLFSMFFGNNDPFGDSGFAGFGPRGGPHGFMSDGFFNDDDFFNNQGSSFQSSSFNSFGGSGGNFSSTSKSTTVTIDSNGNRVEKTITKVTKPDGTVEETVTTNNTPTARIGPNRNFPTYKNWPKSKLVKNAK